MKTMKLSLVIMVAAMLTMGLSGLAYAFHSGGVAECSGCHSMHSPKAAGSYLLVGTDQSSTCLTCHEHAGDTGPSSYHISTADADMATGVKQRTPGGDFGWLRKNFTYTGEDGVTSVTEFGETHGHNIVAIDNGYAADTTNTTAPGGTFPSDQLSCISCHDPHSKARRLLSGSIVSTSLGTAVLPIKSSGSYPNGTSNYEPTATEAVGVYRLLAGKLYTPKSGGVTFNGVPAAKAPSTYNQTEATNQVRVAYGVGTNGDHVSWGAWCSSCHPSMHSTGNYVHAVDTAMSTDIRNNYNAYVKSGDLSGSSATSFSSLVPFATNSGDYSVLAGLAKNNSPTYAGPGSGDQVMCLSCHRAHASGWEKALRWYGEYEFMTKGGQYIGSDNPNVTGTRAGVQHRGRTMADAQIAYYDRPVTQFATYQRVLCNKCHAKD